MFDLTVRGTFQRPAIVGVDMVRRPAGIQEEKYGPAGIGNRSDRHSLPLLLRGIHHSAALDNRTNYAETVHQIHMSLGVVFHFFV